MTKNADMPAMPFTEYDGNGFIYPQHPGLTKREQACIALRVPETGDPELDALIRTAQRRDVAAMAMQGLCGPDSDFGTVGKPVSPWSWVAQEAVEAADALLAALGGGE